MLQALIDAKPRGVPGRPWKPGQSGNPNGRRGERKFKGKTLPELARAMTHDALKVIGEILRDESEPKVLRLQAAEAVLRRGWGDAPTNQQIDPAAFTFVIQQITMDSTPVPGVIRDGLPRPLTIEAEA
jgi:hypothetical protein